MLIWQWQQNLIAPPGFAVHAEMCGQSPHTLTFGRHSLSRCLRSLRNCHIYKSEYFVKTLNMHSTWWLCVFGPRGWEPKNIKRLFLRCGKKVMKKQWSQQVWSCCADSSTWMTQEVKDLTAKYSQTLPFRAKSLFCCEQQQCHFFSHFFIAALPLNKIQANKVLNNHCYFTGLKSEKKLFSSLKKRKPIWREIYLWPIILVP